MMVRDVPEQNNSFLLKNRKVYVQVILLDQFTQHNFVAYDVFTIIRVHQKFSYPLVLWTSTILNLVVRNPRVLV